MSTGVRVGYFKLKLKTDDDGNPLQCNGTISLEPVYPYYQTAVNAAYQDYAMTDYNVDLKVSAYYSDIVITPHIDSQVKYGTESTSKYSCWDESVSSLILGDGEALTISFDAATSDGTAVALNYDYENIAFTYASTKLNKELYPSTEPYIQFVENSVTDPVILLSHSIDYSKDNEKGFWNSSSVSYVAEEEQYNTTCVYDVLYGTLSIPYVDYAGGKTRTYSIKVYLQVRNCEADYSE